jgi:hypothetical protein
MMPLEQRAFVLRTADGDDDDGVEEDDAGDGAAERILHNPGTASPFPDTTLRCRACISTRLETRWLTQDSQCRRAL